MIVLEATPGQSLSVQIAGRRFDLRIFDLGGEMAADVAVNGEQILTACRLVAGTPFIPFTALENGNLILVTDGSEPDWRRFGVDQWLVALPEAAGPTIGGSVASGGGAGPGPGPGPSNLYLERAKNLSDLTDLIAARLNLGVYSSAEVDALLQVLSDAIDALAAEVAALPEPPPEATVAEVRAGKADGKIITPKVMADALAPVVISRADAALGLNFDNFINCNIPLDANVTLGAPSGGYPGKSGFLTFSQNATGGWLVALPSPYVLPDGGITQKTTSGGKTRVPYVIGGSLEIVLWPSTRWA